MGCGELAFDKATTLGKQAILDATHQALSVRNCRRAIELIEPVYESEYVDNDVRVAYASAHACNANINFFTQVMNIVSSPPVGPQLWTYLTENYLSTDSILLEKRIESGRRSFDGLASVLKVGEVVTPIDLINGTTRNPGSLLPADRLTDANVFMVLSNMAMMGSLQNRYGAPNTTTFVQTQPMGATTLEPLGWERAVNTSGDACAFAASLLSMVDTIDEVAIATAGPGSEALSNIADDFKAVLGQACDSGCTANAVGLNAVDYSRTGCVGIPAGTCTGSTSRPCPVELRDRESCTGVISQAASCAAAGIAIFVDRDPLLGWSGGPAFP